MNERSTHRLRKWVEAYFHVVVDWVKVRDISISVHGGMSRSIKVQNSRDTLLHSST